MPTCDQIRSELHAVDRMVYDTVAERDVLEAMRYEDEYLSSDAFMIQLEEQINLIDRKLDAYDDRRSMLESQLSEFISFGF